MISIMLMFGPEHGRVMEMEAPLKEELVIPGYEPPRFYAYNAGEPFTPDRGIVHYYKLFDVYDQGVEEAAIYMHIEECCEKTYQEGEEYKMRHPRDNYGKFKDPMRGKIW